MRPGDFVPSTIRSYSWVGPARSPPRRVARRVDDVTRFHQALAQPVVSTGRCSTRIFKREL